MKLIRVVFRYFVNLIQRVAAQRGVGFAAITGIRFIFAESLRAPRLILYTLQGKGKPQNLDTHSHVVIQKLKDLPVCLESYLVDVGLFHDHVQSNPYPRNYAAGPMDDGGMREQKMLEYFVSWDLLGIKPDDVVIDVASEWSIFPDLVRQRFGCKVYRQDMIYRPGLHGDQIGGSATLMPILDEFASKLVLHNAFEHFEGHADREFIHEAYRVLKPGGILCILPLFMAERHCIVTDPLVNRRSVIWDDNAQILEWPGWHNRFGRFYDADALRKRVLEPGADFKKTIYYVDNVHEVHPEAYLYFALVMQKPSGRSL